MRRRRCRRRPRSPCARSRAPRRPRRAAQHVLAARDESDVGALGRQRAPDRESDAPTAAGDHGTASRQLQIHGAQVIRRPALSNGGPAPRLRSRVLVALTHKLVPPSHPALRADYPGGVTSDGCDTGVCGSDVPPLIGSVLDRHRADGGPGRRRARARRDAAAHRRAAADRRGRGAQAPLIRRTAGCARR